MQLLTKGEIMLEALIGFVGAIVGALFTVAVTKMNNYNQSVSQCRNKWLNDMRENISKMLAYKKALDDAENAEKQIELKREYEYAKNQTLLRLNLSENKHILLKLAIEEFDSLQSYSEETARKIAEISRSILKEEWEKVKYEAKGGK